MKRVREKIGVVQNVSLFDRLVRLFIAAALITGASASYLEVQQLTWEGYAILVSIYPALTGILGWDPFYALLNTRTCGLSERNQCGTFPYQVDAALGRHPVPNRGFEYEHSLEDAHHEKEERPPTAREAA